MLGVSSSLDIDASHTDTSLETSLDTSLDTSLEDTSRDEDTSLEVDASLVSCAVSCWSLGFASMSATSFSMRDNAISDC